MRAESLSDDVPVRRVLMTADAVGGVWTYAIDLASALRQRGVTVTLAVMGPQMRDDQRRDAATRQLEVVEAPFALEWMPDGDDAFDASGAWLRAMAEQCRAELIHLNGFCHASLEWHAPVVVVAHSCVRTWWRAVRGCVAPDSWDDYTTKVTAGLRAARLVVSPTASLLSDLRREYGVIAPSRTIPNGSMAVEAAASRVKKKQWMVFAAGRLWDDAKNISAVVAAAPHVSWPVCVAGDTAGPSESFAATGAVRYLGRLPRDEMRGWYDRASIYALPARYEPFGLSIVEAAASGCALVLGDVPSLRENWSGAAVFVRPDDSGALAGAIESLIRDSDRRAQLGALARARAGRFTMAAMTAAYLDAYASVTTTLTVP